MAEEQFLAMLRLKEEQRNKLKKLFRCALWY